jgi:hypothetical protein
LLRLLFSVSILDPLLLAGIDGAEAEAILVWRDGVSLLNPTIGTWR